MDVDFEIRNEGTLFLVDPISEAAYSWVAEHIPDDAIWWGGAVVVEHRYAQDIIDGISAQGLTYSNGEIIVISDPDWRQQV